MFSVLEQPQGEFANLKINLILSSQVVSKVDPY